MAPLSTLDDLLKAVHELLRDSGLDDPRREAEILTLEVLEIDAGRLIVDRQKTLPAASIERVLSAAKKRAARTPLAYITGRQSFFDSLFLVTPDVLIPRPETEELTEFVLASRLRQGARVLDLCSGSGCIGISLVKARPDLHVTLSDISRAAIEVSRKNAAALVPDARVELIQSDLFQAIDPALRFDVVVSNPPYVHPDEAGGLSPEVMREPERALFAADPAALLATIFRESFRRMNSGGFVAAETSPRFAGPGLKAALEVFPRAVVRKDHSGRDRFVIAFM